MQVELVSVERPIWSGEATGVFARSVDGELGILPHHTPLLASLEPGDRGRFVRVSDSDPAMLRYLAEQGIAPGASVEVVERQPFGGPLFVRFQANPSAPEGEVRPLGGELARAMRVELDGEWGR